MATHSSILAWEIPWTEEPGGLQSTVQQRVGHNGMTEHSTTTNATDKIATSVLRTYCTYPVLLKRKMFYYFMLLMPLVDELSMK